MRGAKNSKNTPFRSVKPNHRFNDLFKGSKVKIMPKHLTATQYTIVQTLLLQKKPQATIASKASCSIRQVTRIAKYLNAFGTSVPPKTMAQGRPFIVTVAMREVSCF